MFETYLWVLFLIDASYSMDEADYHPSRLKAALSAVAEFIRRLTEDRPTACVALACFSDGAHSVQDWTPAIEIANGQPPVTAWHQACEEQGMGNTAMGEGLQYAIRSLSKVQGKGA
jgi:uncharacterized protein YegL